MRTYIKKFLGANGPRNLWPDQLTADAKALFAKLGKYAIDESMLLVRVPMDSQEYQMILEYESHYPTFFDGKSGYSQVDNVFTEKECDEAEYLILWVGNLTYEAGYNPVRYCCEERCFVYGYELDKPYRIEEKSLGKKHLGNMTGGGYVVSIEMKNELEKHDLTNLQFIPALKEHRDEVVGFYLEAPKLLPKLDYFDESKILITCKTTGEHVYTNEIIGQIEISRQIADQMDDFNATSELKTQSGTRYYIISQKMYRIMKQFTIRNFRCEPIKIID